jgi:glutaredoxin
MTTVTLYTKPDCHLCDVAHEVLEGVREDFGFDIEHVDISQDRMLKKRYGVRIPVVAVDGVELFEHRVDDRALRLILTEGMEADPA